jgi:hypothetical protein
MCIDGMQTNFIRPAPITVNQVLVNSKYSPFPIAMGSVITFNTSGICGWRSHKGVGPPPPHESRLFFVVSGGLPWGRKSIGEGCRGGDFEMSPSGPGAMDVTKPYRFIKFGAMDVTKPYRFIGFGAMDVTTQTQIPHPIPWRTSPSDFWPLGAPPAGHDEPRRTNETRRGH